MWLTFKPKVVKQLEALPQKTRERILRKIAFYTTQPDPLSFAKPLTGYDAYRFRIGHHRVIFDCDETTITILLVVGRDGAYRNL